MLSYQHHYHAGNHADVLKHWLLIECIRYLQKKDKPFDYIDTHAGAGLYSLSSKEALKTGESQQGILKLALDKIDGCEAYHDLINQDLRQGKYPGSPLLVLRLLREHDRAWLFELHPQTVKELELHCARKKKSFVHYEDGLKGVSRLLPTQSKRALVLIDPSYEIKSDFQDVINVMSDVIKKMSQTMILCWYPVVDRERINQFKEEIKASALRNVCAFEMGVGADEERGMTASGMIVVNPPWVLRGKFEAVMPMVAQELSLDGQVRCHAEQLIAE